jgi:hypothetical protein
MTRRLAVAGGGGAGPLPGVVGGSGTAGIARYRTSPTSFETAAAYASPAGSGGTGGIAPANDSAGPPCTTMPCSYGQSGYDHNAAGFPGTGGRGGAATGGSSHILGGGAGGLGGFLSASGSVANSVSAGGGAGGSLVPAGGSLTTAAGSGAIGPLPGRDGRVFLRGAP